MHCPLLMLVPPKLVPSSEKQCYHNVNKEHIQDQDSIVSSNTPNTSCLRSKSDGLKVYLIEQTLNGATVRSPHFDLHVLVMILSKSLSACSG